MTRHWTSGPYIVHPGSDTECQRLFCLGLDLRWKRHEYRAECICGLISRGRPKDVIATMTAHLGRPK